MFLRCAVECLQAPNLGRFRRRKGLSVPRHRAAFLSVVSAVQIGSRKIFDGAAFVADNTHAHYGTGGKRMAATAVLGISTDPKAVADAIRELIATPKSPRVRD